VAATPDDIEAASALFAASQLTVMLINDTMFKVATAYCMLGGRLWKHLFHVMQASKIRTALTVDRCEQLLPVIVQMLTKDEDCLLAAMAGGAISWFIGYSYAEIASVLMVPSVVDAILVGLRSFWNPRRHDISWWKVRCEIPNLDTIGITGILCLAFHMANRSVQIAAVVEESWDKLIEMTIELATVYQQAELSAKTRAPIMIFYFGFSLIAKQASFAPKRDGLMKSGVVEPMLYASKHSSPDPLLDGTDPAASAAAVAVQLIGRNEGGLTLSREAAYAVLNAFGYFFDKSKRHFSALASRALADCRSINHMVVSDANKAFIMEHPTAIDSLVSGLLLNEGNPRRTQPGAAELQHGCALALENLALSDIGAGPLRARAHAMEALRKLAEIGMTDEARRCASGALFELEVEHRPSETLSAVSANEHIMLSYNWDHQGVIKRVHSSLVRRGYTTWIDIEKMQGSTVTGVQGVDKLSHGGAVRASAREGHGATDGGGGVSCERVAGDAAGDASVVQLLR
jgi:hypothetical protein